MNENNLTFKLVNNFVCKRCGCTNYDKKIFTGLKTLDEEDAIIDERYVCRNCDFPFDINTYITEETTVNDISITPKELLDESVFIDDGTEIKIDNKGVNNNE